VEVEGRTITCGRSPPELRAGEEVLVCIRTERVQLNPLRDTGHLLEGKVRRIVYRGTDFEATCSFGAQEIRSVVNSVNWDRAVELGAPVRIGFEAADVSLFSKSQQGEIIQYTTEAV